MKFWQPRIKSKKETSQREFTAEALESRILYSAAPAPVAVESTEQATPDENVSGSETDFSSIEEFSSESTTVIEKSGSSTDLGNQMVSLINLDNLTVDEITQLQTSDNANASGEVEIPNGQIPLTLHTLEELASAAEQRWLSTGLTEEQSHALENIEYRIVDLAGNILGQAEGNQITIDIDAAAEGWFIDSTPLQDEEFSISRTSTLGIDLVSVLMHEQGHILGLRDIYDSSQSENIMYGIFDEGERRALTEGEAENAIAGSLQGVNYATTGSIIAGYDFTGVGNVSATTASGVTASDVNGAGGLSGLNSDNETLGDNSGLAASGTAFGSTTEGNFGNVSNGATGNNLTAAIAADDYINFTVNADFAGTLNLSGFSVDTSRANANRAATDFNILAKVDGDGTPWSAVDAITTDQLITTTQSFSDWAGTFVDLSANATFQGIDSVEFRIYFWGANGTQSSSRINIDNLAVEGSIENTAPVGVDDTDTATEAGGIANGTTGTDPTGNVLTNDTDADPGDTPSVNGSVGFARENTAGTNAAVSPGTDSTDGLAVAGLYGTLTIGSDGSYTYVVDNNHVSVQALTSSTDTLTETFEYTVCDDGGLLDTALLTITIEGANDAPTITGTAAQPGISDQETATPFTTVTLGDVDAPAQTLTVDVALDNADKGTLTGSGFSETGANTGVYRFTGTTADATTAIQALTFTPTENRVSIGSTESTTFTISVSDGVVASAVTDNNTTIVVTPVNEAPVNTVPGAQTFFANTAEAINGVSVTDADGNLTTTQLSVVSGILNVTLSGATISAGANNSNTLTLSGSEADINATLASLTYEGTTGNDTLTVVSTDSTGTFDTDTVAITVGGSNAAPANTVPGAQTVDQAVSLAIGGISVTDPDDNLATTQLSVGNGTLTVNLAGGATISSGANNSSTLTLSGSEAQINAALTTLSYQGNPSFSGDDTLTILSTDSAGTPLSDTDTVAITVTPADLGTVLVGWDFGTPGTPPANTASPDPTILASGLTVTTPLDGAGGANDFRTYNAEGNPIGDNTGQTASGTTFGSTESGNFGSTTNDANRNDLAGAILDNDYITFAITADETGTLSVSGFSVAAAIASARSAESFNVLAKIDGDTSAWDAADALTVPQLVSASQSLTDFDDTFINLSGDAAFQGITSVEFRIYLWGGAGGGTSSSRLQIDNLVVEGTIGNSAPEITGDLIGSAHRSGTYVIGASDLGYTDPNDGDSEVTFTVSNQINGIIQVNGTDATTFTGADLAAGLVTFTHDGSETLAASFEVTVADDEGATSLATSFNLQVCPTEGAVLAGFEFTMPFDPTLSRPAATPTTVTDTGVTVSDFTNGAGISFQQTPLIGDNTGFDAEGNAVTNSQADGNFSGTNSTIKSGSHEAAISNDDYLTFSITPDAGNELDLTSLSFQASLRSAARSAEFFAVHALIGGEAATVGNELLLGTITQQPEAQNTGDYDDFVIDLSGAEFQNVTETIEFRFYIWGGSGGSSSTRTNIDNVILRGASNNEAPVLTGDLAATIDPGETYLITAADLGYTDTDDGPEGITFNVSNELNGKVQVDGADVTSFTATQLANGEVTFVHDYSATTSATFDVHVEDGNEDCSIPVDSTFNFTVNALAGGNAAPLLRGDLAATIDKGATYTITAQDLGYADPDDGDAEVTFTTSNPQNGKIQVNGADASTFTGTDLTAGLVTFIHDDTITTSASFDVNVEDGNEDSSAPLDSTFSFDVIVNVAPELTGDLRASIDPGNTYIIIPADLGYTDPDDIDAGVTFTTSGATNGKIQVNGIDATTFTGTELASGRVSFVHDNSDTDIAYFRVNVEDGNEDGSTPTDSFFIFDIAARNTPPVLTGDLEAAIDQGDTYTITGDDLGYTDLEDIDEGVFFTSSNPVNGKVQVNGVDANTFTGTQLTAGEVTFVHNGSAASTASFHISVEDGDEDNSMPTTRIFRITLPSESEDVETDSNGNIPSEIQTLIDRALANQSLVSHISIEISTGDELVDQIGIGFITSESTATLTDERALSYEYDLYQVVLRVKFEQGDDILATVAEEVNGSDLTPYLSDTVDALRMVISKMSDNDRLNSSAQEISRLSGPIRR